MDACELLAQVTATVDYLRVSTAATDDDRQWLSCGPLTTEPERLLALVRSTAAGRGTDRDDVAMSLFVQGYAFRIASLAVGGWLLGDSVLDVSPATTAIALGRDRPNAVRVDRPRLVDDDLHQHLVDAPSRAARRRGASSLSRSARHCCGRNVGASCASSFAAFVDPLPDRRAEIRRPSRGVLRDGTSRARSVWAGGPRRVPMGVGANRVLPLVPDRVRVQVRGLLAVDCIRASRALRRDAAERGPLK